MLRSQRGWRAIFAVALPEEAEEIVPVGHAVRADLMTIVDDKRARVVPVLAGEAGVDARGASFARIH
ncbi:hypothetical protein LMG27198_04980 [Methylocystis echinoides]|uniref:Uncharacterized protein n=1 Tax=Methylocystis echinoides TaxID=29468 RepID=A0A9W6LQL6_9HYPH|nr:hypothetical protein LMG27198_04980 [Methylocystis echinoides]